MLEHNSNPSTNQNDLFILEGGASYIAIRYIQELNYIRK